MNFLKEIGSSIYNKEFYKRLLTEKFSFSIKYFYRLIIVLALVYTVVISIALLPPLTTFLNSVGSRVLSVYPDDGLEVVVKSGHVSVNKPEPYFIHAPAELQREGAPKKFENIIVIDTQHNFSKELFEQYNTAVLLMQDGIAIETDQGIRIQSLDRAGDITINKALMNGFVQKVTPFFKFIPPLVVIVVLVGTILFFHLKLVYLLLGALLVWGIARAKKLKIGYKKAYQISIHAITLGLLVKALFLIIAPHSGFPFLFTLLLVIVAAINLESDSGEIPTPITDNIPLPKTPEPSTPA